METPPQPEQGWGSGASLPERGQDAQLQARRVDKASTDFPGDTRLSHPKAKPHQTHACFCVLWDTPHVTQADPK